MKIDGVPIGPEHEPYVIAEVSANHNGDIDTAKELIMVAHKAGASAVKLQTYTPDTITLNSSSDDFKINDGLWAGRTLYDLYKEAHTPWEWHKPLFNYAKKIGITIFSSPFDKTAIDMLEDLNAPAYKIASFEAIDHELIAYAARTKKPLIISTGMADRTEIQEAIEVARSNGCNQLSILHCVSGYPAPHEDYNLLTIKDMITRFDCITGLSDHTVDNITAIASIAFGASIIEKHFTLDRKGGGPDDSFSLEPNELKLLCDGVKTAWQSIGDVDYGKKSSELGNIKFRRSLYFVREINKGDEITEKSIRSVRPGYGIPPKYLKKIIGKKVLSDIKKNSPVRWKDIE